MNRRLLILTACTTIIALAAVAVILTVFHGTGKGSASTGKPIPAGALESTQLLLSASGHDAVTPELNLSLPSGRLFPAGTSFDAAPLSWHQDGSYANETGTLREPEKPPAQVEIGFVRRDGRWLVTFEERL